MIDLCGPDGKITPDKQREKDGWRFLLKMLLRMTARATSSDETDIDQPTGREVYRVKIIVWRRDISRYLKYIDDHREEGFYEQRGSKGLWRDGVGPESLREAMKGLPRSFYADEWFEEVDDDRRMITLKVSKEEFNWVELAFLKKQA